VELIERRHALQLLQGAFAQAEQGAGRTALVCGEAGIGKTSLVMQLVSGHPEARVLWGGCEALFSPRPLGPLYDMAGALGTKLQAMLGLEGQRAELFSALLANLHESRGTTVMVLEDLHWADAATLDMAKFLARRIQRTRTLLVLTFRDDELGEQHPLRFVLGDVPADSVVRLPLLPLSESGVAELARQSSRSAEGLFSVTGGNPFFVTEALRAEGLPATVRDAVLARAARQPAPVRALLDLAAIVPARIAIGLVDRVLAPSQEVVSAALASGLLAADGRSYAYRHELARIAIEQALPGPRAAALHAKLLACLETAEGEVELTHLVHHAAGAGDSAAVLTYAQQAGAEAVLHASHCDAAYLYGMALSHSGGLDAAARAGLLEHRAYQCYLTDQIDNAIAARLSALAIWRSLGDRQQEGRALRWLSRLHWFIGRNREAESYADQAVALLESLPAGSELAWALSNRSQLHMLAGATDDAVAWGLRAIEMATQQGEVEVLTHALNNVGAAEYERGRAGGLDMLERSLGLALEHGYGEHVGRAYANLTSAAIKVRDYPTAQRLMGDATAYFAARDLDSWSNYVRAWQSRLDFERGRWDAAATLAAQLVTRPGVAPVTRIPALAVLARLRMRRGDPGVKELLAEALALAQETGEVQRIGPAAAALAEAAWLGHDCPRVEVVLQQACALAEQHQDERALGELRFWARRLGHRPADTGGVEAPYALQFSGPWEEAAETWAQLGCPYERALALMEGDEAAMREALALFDAMGASATAKRCREHLRDAGVRGVARGPRASTSANPAGLTAREVQILGLLAQGLTNAEIAGRLVRSEKTVDHHISAVLRKLEVRSRSEAAAVANRLGLIGSA